MGSERYEIKTLKEAFDLVKDKDLEIVISEFEKDFSKIARFTGIYTSIEEIVAGIRERVFDGLRDRYNDFKSRISYARKHGADINPTDFEILRVPLKLKRLEAVFSLDNYKVVVEILNNSEKQLIEFEKEVEEFERQREIAEAKREGRKPILKAESSTVNGSQSTESKEEEEKGSSDLGVESGEENKEEAEDGNDLGVGSSGEKKGKREEEGEKKVLGKIKRSDEEKNEVKKEGETRRKKVLGTRFKVLGKIKRSDEEKDEVKKEGETGRKKLGGLKGRLVKLKKKVSSS